MEYHGNLCSNVGVVTTSSSNAIQDSFDELNKELFNFKKQYEEDQRRQAAYNPYTRATRDQNTPVAYYGTKAVENQCITPGSIVVLNKDQFSMDAAQRFAKQNPSVQVTLARNPETAMRVYPVSGGREYALGIASNNISAGQLVAKDDVVATATEQYLNKYIGARWTDELLRNTPFKKAPQVAPPTPAKPLQATRPEKHVWKYADL